MTRSGFLGERVQFVTERRERVGRRMTVQDPFEKQNNNSEATNLPVESEKDNGKPMTRRVFDSLATKEVR